MSLRKSKKRVVLHKDSHITHVHETHIHTAAPEVVIEQPEGWSFKFTLLDVLRFGLQVLGCLALIRWMFGG